MIAAADNNLSEEGKGESASLLGISKASSAAVPADFQEKIIETREPIITSEFGVPSFSQLQWRLDVQLAGRSLRHQAAPSFLLKLKTKPCHVTSSSEGAQELPIAFSEEESAGEDEEVQYLVSDFETLKQVCRTLEQALVEAKSGRARRIMQYVK